MAGADSSVQRGVPRRLRCRSRVGARSEQRCSNAAAIPALPLHQHPLRAAPKVIQAQHPPSRAGLRAQKALVWGTARGAKCALTSLMLVGWPCTSAMRPMRRGQDLKRSGVARECAVCGGVRDAWGQSWCYGGERALVPAATEALPNV